MRACCKRLASNREVQEKPDERSLYTFVWHFFAIQANIEETKCFFGRRRGSAIELSVRQLEMIRLVKQHAPITGEQIAEQLNLSRPTIRSDLALLVMLGYLDAKPKVGYFLGNAAASEHHGARKLLGLKVKDVQSIPVIVLETATVHDAVVVLFMENVGTLMVTDAEGSLRGMVSRKDLLKVTLGNPSAATMPVSLVMTRQPNIITVSPEEAVIEAARKMIHHQVDSLPVVATIQDEKAATSRQEIVGRITKTTMTRLLVGFAADPGSV